MKLNPLAEWTEDEVWDYLRDNDVPDPRRSTRKGLHVDRLRAPARARSRPASRRAPGAGGGRPDAPKECGMHCSIETGGLRARAARDPRRGGARMTARAAEGRRARGRARRGRGRARRRSTRATTATGSTSSSSRSPTGTRSRAAGGRARPPAHARAPVGARPRALRAGRRAGRAPRVPQAADGVGADAERERGQRGARRAPRAARSTRLTLTAVGPGAFTLAVVDGRPPAHGPARPPGCPS